MENPAYIEPCNMTEIALQISRERMDSSIDDWIV